MEPGLRAMLKSVFQPSSVRPPRKDLEGMAVASCAGVMLWLCLVVFATGCTTIRKNHPKPVTRALPASSDTVLGARYAESLKKHPGESGFYLLRSGYEAFLARACLAESAQRSIDVQYYIVHGDQTGKLLIQCLLKAADRGVRVRLLVDDHHTGGRDLEMAALDAHPNFQVRIFNPYSARQLVLVSRPVDFLLHPSRLNRRMHNKVFAVDNQVAIVGGRNLGDEYFDASRDLEFHDLDLMAVGPITQKISASFDDYWNSPWAVPIGALRSSKTTATEYWDNRRDLDDHWQVNQSTEYVAGIKDAHFSKLLQKNTLPLIWAKAELFCDPPRKIAGQGPDSFDLLMGSKLRPTLASTHESLDIIAPYFVAGDATMDLINTLRSRGVRVRILSNSLGSTDCPIIHVGYIRYRKALVMAGVEMYEFKPDAKSIPPKHHRAASRSVWTSMHAKAFVFDRRTVFVGSLNVTQRSMRLNTEMGLIVDSPDLAQQVTTAFEQAIHPDSSYRIFLKTLPANTMRGESSRTIVTLNTMEQGVLKEYAIDPNAAWWRYGMTILLSLMPLEDVL